MKSYEQQQRDDHEKAAGQRAGEGEGAGGRAGVRVPRPPGAQLRTLVVAVVEVVDTVARCRCWDRCRGRGRGGQRGQQETDQHSP